MLIFLTEVAIGICGYIKHSELQDTLDGQFNGTLIMYNTSNDARLSWKKIQSELKCCGVNGPDDWKTIFNNGTVPDSCCENRQNCTRQISHKDGCKSKLYALLDESALLLGFVGLGIAGIQLLGVCMGCCLSRGFKENYEAV